MCSELEVTELFLRTVYSNQLKTKLTHYRKKLFWFSSLNFVVVVYTGRLKKIKT